MKVWEAIELLRAVDGNMEVNLSFGVKRTPLDFTPVPSAPPARPFPHPYVYSGLLTEEVATETRH